MYLKKNKIFKHIDFIILDFLCMEVSFVIAYYIRHRNFLLFEISSYRSVLIILIVASLFTCYYFDSMKDVIKRSKQLEFYATIRHIILTTFILIGYIYITQIGEDISRNIMIIFPIFYLILSYIFRLIYKFILTSYFKYKTNRCTVLIADEKNAKKLIKKIYKNTNDILIKGVILLDKDVNNATSVSGIPVVADANNYTKYLQTEYVDEVIMSASGKLASDIIERVSIMGIVLHIELPDEFDFIAGYSKLFVDSISDINVITSTVNIISPLQLIVKRIVDIIFGIIGSFMTLVFAITIGPVIKFKSPGPIFFTQDRVGKNGKTFKMIKFRSMRVDAEEQKKKLKEQNENKDGLMFKISKDPRIIPGIGEFIRKTSIDEFPQFINVLKGEMSVVGTRPPTLDEWEKYDLHHRARLVIKPGITGLWQVSGRSNIKDFEDVVKLDTEYIKTFSLWQDFYIILKTIKVVLFKEGAK